MNTVVIFVLGCVMGWFLGWASRTYVAHRDNEFRDQP